MKWHRWLVIGSVCLGLAAGCGEDDDNGVQINQNQEQNQEQNQQQNQNQDNQNQDNQNQDNQNQDNQNNDEEDDEFADAVDVWIGAENENVASPTPVEVGETFGGRFSATGVHYFMIELDAGDVVTLSTSDLESGLEDDPEQVEVHFRDYLEERDFITLLPTRQLWVDEHDEREFFVPRDGAYEFEVYAPGGDDNGFAFEASVDSLETDGELELPGTTEGGDLDDGRLDALDAGTEEDQSAALEVFAQREPVSSQLDSWVYVWDVTAGETVAESTGQGEEIADPFTTADFMGDSDYAVIVDMGANVTDAAYEIESEFIATTETNPQPLSLDAVDEFEGRIEQWDAQAYRDYFEVTVEPGDYKRLTVEGDGELEPYIQASEEDQDPDNFFTSPPSVDGIAVENDAGVTLGVADGASEAMTFDIEVTDQRNVFEDEEELDEFYGGEDYDYTLRLEPSDATPWTLEDGDVETVSLDSPGDLERIEVSVPEQRLVWLDSGSDTEITEDDEIYDYDYIPGWAFGDGTTAATAHPFDGYLWSAEAEYSFLMRDYFFRGADAGYETDIRALSFDVEAPDYGDADLVDDNESLDEASEVELPARIEGEFVDSGDGQDDEIEPDVYYFSFDAEEGDFFVGHTENDTVMESALTVMNDDGDVLAASGLYMEQRQEGGEDEEPYYDGAVVYEVAETGTYYLAVEQFCSGFSGCDVGEVSIGLFLESAPDDNDDDDTDVQ